MRRRLAAWLRVLAGWIEPSREPCDVMARLWVREAEAGCAPGTSGEYKRHLVYARLVKTFPELPKRRASQAIEDAMRGV